ncbi:MAG: GNAT family N-acetyltransferase [Clostridia bacterium]
MVQGKWLCAGGDLSPALALRTQILGVGEDATDELAQQVLVFNGAQAVGTARLWWADGAFCIGMLCVLPQERGKGFGDLLIRLLLFKALTHAATLIRVDAPAPLVPFFAKYGFRADALELPANGSVPMCMRGQDVQLSHCGGGCDGCSQRE